MSEKALQRVPQCGGRDEANYEGLREGFKASFDNILAKDFLA